MLVGLCLFEAFKADVASEVIPITSCPTTVRRRLIDIAGKIVRKSHQKVLKVTAAVWEGLDFEALWRRANLAPAVALE